MRQFILPYTFRKIEEDSDTTYFFKVGQKEMHDKNIHKTIDLLNNAIKQDVCLIYQVQRASFVYSILRNFDQNIQAHNLNILQKIGHTLIIALQQILNRILKQNLKYTQTGDLFMLRNTFKIVLFLVFYYLQTSVVKKQKGNNDMINNIINQEKRRKKKKDLGDYAGCIASIQGQLICLLSKSFQIQIQLLWAKEPIDNQLINYYGDSCVKVLQNPLFWMQIKSKNSLIRILDNSIKRQTVFKLIKKKLFDIIAQDQQCVPIIVDLFYNIDMQTTPIGNILRQFLIQMTNNLLAKTKLSAESQLFRNSKQFYIQLCEKLPKLFSNNLCVFLHLYQCQSHFLRNAATQILSKLIQHQHQQKQEDNKNQMKLMQIILQRIYDQNALCRSHTLACIIQLVRLNLLALGFLPRLLRMSADRIKDVSSKVRRKAIQLFKYILNIYLYRFGFSQSYNQFISKFISKEQIQEHIFDCEQQIKQYQNTIDQNRKMFESLEQDIQRFQQLETQVNLMKKKIDQNRTLHQRFMMYRQMIVLLHELMDSFISLLGSKNQSDVLETILLFGFLYQSNLGIAEKGIKKMLVLIYSKQKKIRQQMITCYINIFFSKNVDNTADSLIKLFIHANLQQLACLEQLIQVIISKDKEKPAEAVFPKKVFKIIWEKFINCIKNDLNPQLARVSILILRILNKFQQQHIQSFQGVVKKFIQTTRADFIILKQIAIIAKNLQIEQQNSRKFVVAFIHCLIENFGCKNREWYIAAQQIVSCIYKKSSMPQKYCQFLLKKCIEKLNLAYKSGQQTQSQCSLSQLIFLLGHISLKMLIHVDQLDNKMKFIKNKKQQQQTEEIEAVVGGAEAEYQRKVQQLNLITQNMIFEGINGHFLPVIENIVQKINGQKQVNSQIQRSSVLTMCKFMCVSQKYCNNHLQVIFTILGIQKVDPIIKNNIIISMGDLLHRFPNSIQPYSKRLYQKQLCFYSLHDDNTRVRKTTLMVLTHLILNDMVKLKGEICQLALLFQDPEPQIQSLVSLFFYQISNKDNKFLYNILPQAISRLSQNTLPCGKKVNQKTFQNFAKKTFSYLQKEKYSEGLIQKLCLRFNRQNNLFDWRNTSLCISLMAKVMNQKGLRKLIQLYEGYRQKLLDDCISNNFKSLLGQLKKKKKPQFKSLIEQLQHKLDNFDEEKFDAQNVKKNKGNNRKKKGKGKRQKVISKKADKVQRNVLMQIQQQESQPFQQGISRRLRQRRNRKNMIIQDQSSMSEQQ